MSVYTVHEPPPRTASADAAEQFRFVRDGFYWWAFLLTPLWLVFYRLWLSLLLFLMVTIAVEVPLSFAGVSTGLRVLVGLLISLLVGFEAGTLRRWTLARRGWANIGVVVADDLEAAERRFFDAWAAQPRRRTIAPDQTLPGLPPLPGAAASVLGLFPEPGVQR